MSTKTKAVKTEAIPMVDGEIAEAFRREELADVAARLNGANPTRWGPPPLESVPTNIGMVTPNMAGFVSTANPVVANPPTVDHKYPTSSPTPPASLFAPVAEFNPNPPAFDTTFRDSETTSTSIHPSVKTKKEPKSVTNHRTTSTAISLVDSDDEDQAGDNVRAAAKSGDQKKIEDALAAFAALNVAKGAALNSKQQTKGKKGSKSTESLDPNGMLLFSNLRGTNRFKIPQSIAKDSYTIKRFYKEHRNPKTIMVPASRFDGDTQPTITGLVCIPAAVEGTDGKMTRAAKAVTEHAKAEFTETMPSTAYRALETINEESNGKLKMSDTLSILFEELRLWAPLQHETEWLEIVKNKTGNFHRHVFTAPCRGHNPSDQPVLRRFITLSHIRTATAAVGNQEKLFGSMTSTKDAAANREAALKFYEAADTANELSRKHVQHYEINYEVKQVFERTKASYMAYAYDLARLKQLMVYSQGRSFNLSKEIVNMFVNRWNDPQIVALEKQLPAITLTTSTVATASTATPASVVYASAQPNSVPARR